MHNSKKGEIQQKKKKENSNGNERVVLEKFCNDFVVVWQETGEGNKAENLGNDRIFLDLNNRDLSGCFGKFLQ